MRQGMTEASALAFTRLELCLSIAAITLIAGVAFPSAATRARAQQAVCFGNLRQIGHAHQVWANDHGDVLPQFIPPSEGGSKAGPPPATATVWAQLAVLSNELVTPNILACPSDTKRPAGEFSTDPQKGLSHANFRSPAVSYFLGHPVPQTPRDILSGDGKMILSQQSVGFSIYGNSPANITLNPLASNIGWTNTIHIFSGNILYADGQVEQLFNTQLRAVLSQPLNDNTSLHILLP